MSEKFTVLEGKKSNNKDYSNASRLLHISQLWCNYYDGLVRNLIQRAATFKELAELPQDELMKFGCVGIKTVCANREARRQYEIASGNMQSMSLEESQAMFQLIDAIFTVCGYLTLRNFVITFPIEKDFDGKKWECKDYFYTMEVLSKMDWDKPIGRDNISNLLWDYQNHELRRTYVEYTSVMSNMYRSQTGKGIAETWLEDMGVGTYTINNDLGIIRDNKTGEISKLSKKPSHLQIVK